MRKNMEKRIELWVFPTGNVAVYRGSAFIPTEQLTEEERLFVLDRVYNELGEKDLESEIKKYTENLYNETFGNGQGTLDEFDWEDISTVIEDTAKHFYSLRPQPKQEWSEEDRDSVAQYLHDRDGGMLWSKATEITSDILDILRPHPSWKPSEDEERLINTSISFLKDFADKGYENAVECIDWLKSKLMKNE